MIVLYIIFLLFLSTTNINCQVCPSGYVYSPSNGCRTSLQTIISSGYCTLKSGGGNTFIFAFGYEAKSPCDATIYDTKTWNYVEIISNSIPWYQCSSSDFSLIYYSQVGGCRQGDTIVTGPEMLYLSNTNRYFVASTCQTFTVTSLFVETYSQPTTSPAVANNCAVDYTGSITEVYNFDYGTTLCPIGFTGALPCTIDINECTDVVDSCISPASCYNTIGSYYCQCNIAGYRLGGDGKSCVEINECAEGTSGCSNFCTNTPGSFTCSCEYGYSLGIDLKTCSEINECAEGTSGCSDICTNTPGSFTCSCDYGYSLGTDLKTCSEINECTEGTSGCSDICTNTPGSFTCSCDYGYQLTSDQKTCVTSHYIQSITPSFITGGNSSFYGEFTSVHEHISLFIGDKVCDIKFVSNDLIICTAPPGSGIHSVNLTQNGLIYIGKNIYQYQTEIKQCLNDCTSIIHGECITATGQCKCNPGYTSYDCSIENIDGEKPITNSTIGSGGTILFNEQTNFEIYFKSLLEIDINGGIVEEYTLSSNNWVSNKTDSNIVTFTQSINQTTTNKFKISYIVEQVIGDDKEFSFAGTNFTVSKGSIKFTIIISNYTYSSVLNTLRLDLISSVNELNENDCNLKDTTFNSNQLLEFNYFKFSKNSKEFNFRFINRALVDGRPTFISITSNTYDTKSIIISLNLAHFSNNITIDPDFSLLVSNDYKSECDESSTSRKWLIPVVVVVPVVGLSIIIVGTIIILKKNVSIRIGVAKLKNLKK